MTTTYPMTIDGQSRTVTVHDNMIDGLNSVMVRANEAIEKVEDKWTTVSAYFENVLQGHGADLDATVERALASYNGSDAPPPSDPPPLTGEELKASLRGYAANKRYTVESGGCIDQNGNAIATDRDSQTKLLAELVAIDKGLRVDPSKWKLRENGFVSLTNAQMMQAIMAARTHVANAFAGEDVVRDAIEAETITTPAQIDAANWPSNS